MTWTALAAALALLPGFLAWWWSRRLVPLADDAALPERLIECSRRLNQVTVVMVVGAILMAPERWPWAVILSLGATLVGWFPARRALFSESWGFFSYLSHTLRVTVALAGFWLLLIFTPMAIHAAGPLRWLGATFFAALLILWNAYFPEILLRLVRAKSLERPDLESRFAALLARAKTTPPRLYRAGPAGGRWANAFALPSLRGPAVLFTETILELLDPEEITAIFAHEVAHLEHYHRRRLFWLNLRNWAAIALAALAIPLLMGRFEAYAGFVELGWIIAVAVTLLSQAVRHKAHEAESDRRAVSLCADPETFARALEKLHLIIRLPRRWGIEMERKATHPSLAQRLQAIRAAAGSQAAALDRPIAVGSPTPGRFVIFEAERAHWLEGAPPDTQLDAATLHERATHVRSIVYSELIDLRVQATLRGDVLLVATDRTGHSWSVPLRSEDVASAQSALDLIDARLARRALGVAHHPWLSAFVAALAAVVAIFAWNLEVTGIIGTLLLAALVALIRPGPTSLAAFGAVALGTVILSLGHTGAMAPEASTYFGSLAAMALLGGLALWLAITQARRTDERRTLEILLTTGVLGIAALIVWSALIWSATVEPMAIRLNSAAKSTPSATLALLGLAAALLMIQRRSARWAAATAAALAILPLILASGWFLARFGRDPLFALEPALREEERSLSIVRQAHLDIYATALRLSPSGLWYAALPEGDHHDISSFRVGNFFGSHREIQAHNLEFLSDTHLLALPLSSSRPELAVISVKDPKEVSWRRALPKIKVLDLSVDPPTRAWRVTGLDERSSQLVLLSGSVGQNEVNEKRWGLPNPAGSGWFSYAVSGDAALGISTISNYNRALWFGALFLPTVRPVQSELWLIAPEGSRRLLTSALEARCLKPQIAAEPFICSSYDGERTLFWSLHPANGMPRFLGSIPERILSEAVGPDGRIALRPLRGGLMLLDLATGQALRLKLPPGHERSFGLALVPGLLAGLSDHSKGTTITIYKIVEAQTTLMRPDRPQLPLALLSP